MARCSAVDAAVKDVVAGLHQVVLRPDLALGAASVGLVSSSNILIFLDIHYSLHLQRVSH